MPIAATNHSVAAVVSPRTESPCRMIAPAPRKPMPLTICAAMRVGSNTSPLGVEKDQSDHAYAETIVNSAEPTDTSRCVRNPAPRSRSSRSNPIAPPSSAARPSRQARSTKVSSGKRVRLRLRDPLDPTRCELEQLVEELARERRSFCRCLNLDEAPVARHHDVHVGLRRRVLRVLEVQHRLAVDDPDRHRGDRVGEDAQEAEAVERAVRGDVRTRDRGAARAAVCLEHVAVEPHRSLAERFEVDDGTERAADQPLDLDGPPTLLPARRLALHALAGRRRQQRVLGGHPTAPAALQPARDLLLDHRGAEHLRLPLREEDGAVRLLEVVELERERAELVGAPAFPHAATPSSSVSATCSTAAIGSCRNRAPVSRNVSGDPVVRNLYAPSRSASFSMPLRASVSATSRAVSSAEKTSVTSRPKTRCRIGLMIG